MEKGTFSTTISDHIEEAAFALWEERGINNTSISDICKRANVGRTTFYRYYKNEGDIIKSYLAKCASFYDAKQQSNKSRTSKNIIQSQLLSLKEISSKLSIIANSGYRYLLSEILWPDLALLWKKKLSNLSADNCRKYYDFGGFVFLFLAWVESGIDLEAKEISLFLCNANGLEPDKERSAEEIRGYVVKAKQPASISSDVTPKIEG